MSNEKFTFWTRCLFGANIMTIGVGLLTAFAGNSIIFEVHNKGTQAVFLDGAAWPAEVLALKNWLFGIIGGSIVGFHVLILFIIKNSFAKREVWAYWALWVGLLSWFVIDSSISLYYKAYHNLYLINLVALFLIGWPLLMTRSYFKEKTSQYSKE